MDATSPTISIQGSLNGTGALASQKFLETAGTPPYGAYWSGNYPTWPFLLEGNATMKGESFSNELMIDNITGNWKMVDPNPGGSWQITSAEWGQLLLSPLNGILIAIVAAIVVIDVFFLARRHDKSV